MNKIFIVVTTILLSIFHLNAKSLIKKNVLETHVIGNFLGTYNISYGRLFYENKVTLTLTPHSSAVCYSRLYDNGRIKLTLGSSFLTDNYDDYKEVKGYAFNFGILEYSKINSAGKFYGYGFSYSYIKWNFEENSYTGSFYSPFLDIGYKWIWHSGITFSTSIMPIYTFLDSDNENMYPKEAMDLGFKIKISFNLGYMW